MVHIVIDITCEFIGITGVIRINMPFIGGIHFQTGFKNIMVRVRRLLKITLIIQERDTSVV